MNATGASYVTYDDACLAVIQVAKRRLRAHDIEKLENTTVVLGTLVGEGVCECTGYTCCCTDSCRVASLDCNPPTITTTMAGPIVGLGDGA